MSATLTRTQFHQLIEERTEPAVSLYMPTRAIAARDSQQEIIRFKNLVRQVEEGLSQRGLRSRELEAFLKPLEPLFVDTPFWSHQSDGLAIFLSRDNCRILRLPQTFREEATVSDRFRLKPLLGLLNYHERYALLALSLNGVRLLECSIYGVREYENGDFPGSLAGWAADSDHQQHLQTRSVAGRGGGPGGSVIHGHGGDQKSELSAYLRAVDAVVVNQLASSGLPLMLAGVENVVAQYREVSGYDKILPQFLPGSPERLHSNELQRLSWPLFLPLLEQERVTILARYQDRKLSGQASNQWHKILPAVTQGRVESLLLADNAELQGTFDLQTLEVQIPPKDASTSQDLAEYCALQAYLHGGSVHIVPSDFLPESTQVVCVFRY